MTGIYQVELLEWSTIFKRIITLIVFMTGSDTLTGGVWFLKDLFLSCVILSLLGGNPQNNKGWSKYNNISHDVNVYYCCTC